MNKILAFFSAVQSVETLIAKRNKLINDVERALGVAKHVLVTAEKDIDTMTKLLETLKTNG